MCRFLESWVNMYETYFPPVSSVFDNLELMKQVLVSSLGLQKAIKHEGQWVDPES